MLGVYMALLETEEDRERFDKLYRQHREQLFRIALSVMKDICSAEDVVSEVFMIIAKNFSALRKKTDRELFGYIAIITRNRAIDIYRRQKSEAETVTFDEAYSQTELMQNAPTGETDEALKLILRLSEEHRDILILKYYYGFSMHEVADMLKLPYDTVKSRMKRAKKLLKDELNKAAKKA